MTKINRFGIGEKMGLISTTKSVVIALVFGIVATFFCSSSVEEFEIPRPSEIRAWVDNTGDYSTQAYYKSSDDSSVVLILASSKKEVTVALDRLSDKDKEIVRCFAVTPTNPKAAVLLGDVIDVTDGDTVKFRTTWGDSASVRLSDIDAPESNQPFGLDARNALRSMVLNKSVTETRLEVTKKDKYNRLIGTLYIDGIDINHKMVEIGLAWNYPEYSERPELATVESEAKKAKLGLWAETAVSPWDWRHNASLRQQTSSSSGNTAKDNSNTTQSESKSETVYITKTGEKYHRSGCRYLSKSKIPIALDQAKQRYSPCSVCKPPSHP